MVMAVFAYIYHQSFIVPETLSTEMILEQVCLPCPLVVYKLMPLDLSWLNCNSDTDIAKPYLRRAAKSIHAARKDLPRKAVGTILRAFDAVKS